MGAASIRAGCRVVGEPDCQAFDDPAQPLRRPCSKARQAIGRPYTPPVPARPLLAVDTASPVVSVAVALGDRVLAAREGAQRESSARLIDWIDDVLREAGIGLDDLAGAVALRGPGSFTGLRVGLATLLGFHQAIGLSVTGLPTLAVLAAAAPAKRRVLALVPAGPGEWFAQPYESEWPPRELGEPRRVPADELAAGAEDNHLLVVATAGEAARFGGLAHVVEPSHLGHPARVTESRLPVLIAGPLAPVAARFASLHPPAWDAALLSAPLYLAPAPVTVPGAPKPVLPLSVPPAVAERRERER